MISSQQLLYTSAMFDQYMKKSGLRFGQHFCNTFGVTDPNVFYENNTDVAIAKIREKYVKD